MTLTQASSPAQTPAPVADARVLRERTRAELRIAERAAALDLAERRRQLAEQARERRHTAEQRRAQERAERRAHRRKQRRQRAIAALRSLSRGGVHIGENVIMVPILAATASAWWFQFEALRTAGLAVLLAGTVATALESLGLAFAGLAHKARAANDSALLYRAGMWAVVAVAAAVNYRHGSLSWSQPGLIGIVFASLSVGSITGWELRERQAYRERIADRLPPRLPRFGYARWLRYPVSTGRALSIAIRDGQIDTVTALAVAACERNQRHSLRRARRVFGRTARKLLAQRLAAAEPSAHPPSALVDPKAATTTNPATSNAAPPPTVANPGQPRPERRLLGRLGRFRLATSYPTTAPAPNPPVTPEGGDSAAPKRARSRHLHAVGTTTHSAEIDISDLREVAHEVAAELGDHLSRDSLVDGIRARGHSVGGRRRRAIYDTVLAERHATHAPAQRDQPPQPPKETQC